MARTKKLTLVTKTRKPRQVVDETFTWEIIEMQTNPIFTHLTRRAKVIGGWLVETFADKNNAPSCLSLYFVQDAKHKWIVKKPETVNAPQATSPEQIAA